MSAAIHRLNLRRSFHGITFGYLFLTALIIVLGATSFRMSKVGTDQSVELSSRLLPSLEAVAGLQEAMLKYNLSNQEYVTARDDQTQARKRTEAADMHRTITARIAALDGFLSSSGVRPMEEAITNALTAYDDANKRLQAALNDNEFDAAMKILDGDMVKAYAGLEGAVAKLSRFVFDLANRNGDQTRQILERNLRTTLMLSAVIGGIALLSMFAVQVISLRMRRQFSEVSRVLGTEAADILDKAGNFNRSSISLAERANQQAASLEESSASLEEMAGMTKRNAEAAKDAKDIAAQTRRAVDAGAASMQRMASTMEEIKSSSNEISKIIKTIDEIAFQTNLLALNAAVEAARAGEAGAGFAVVADEVRSLAQRSATAARETAGQIEAAVRKSEDGARMSVEVLNMLNQIVGEVRRMDDLVAEIATASSEQSHGVAQVTTAVSEMDSVTQGNAATAEESASAAHELSTQASELQKMVSNLRALVGGAAAAGAAVAPTALAYTSKPTPTARYRTGGGAGARSGGPKHFAPLR